MEQLLSSGSSVALVHFTYTDSVKWYIACMPSLTEFHKTKNHPPHQRTNAHQAVTCSMCKKSAYYKAATTNAR